MYHCPYCKQTYKVLNRCPKKVCQMQLMKDHRPAAPPVHPPKERHTSVLRTPAHPSSEDHDGLAFAAGVAAGAALSSVFDDSDDNSRNDDSSYDGGGGDFGGGGSSGGFDD